MPRADRETQLAVPVPVAVAMLLLLVAAAAGGVPLAAAAGPARTGGSAGGVQTVYVFRHCVRSIDMSSLAPFAKRAFPSASQDFAFSRNVSFHW